MSKSVLLLIFVLSACADNVYYIYQLDSGSETMDGSQEDGSNDTDAATEQSCECSEGYCCDGCHLIKRNETVEIDEESEPTCYYPYAYGFGHLRTSGPTTDFIEENCYVGKFYQENDGSVINYSESDNPEISPELAIIYHTEIITYHSACTCDGLSAWPTSCFYRETTVENCDEQGKFCAQKLYSEIDSTPVCTNECNPWDEE